MPACYVSMSHWRQSDLEASDTSGVGKACCKDCGPLGLTEQQLRVCVCVCLGKGESLGETILMFLPPALDIFTKLWAMYHHVFSRSIS